MSRPSQIPLRPAWIQVDPTAIEHNTRRLKEIVGPGVELMAMVKANAYGHGAVESSRAALRGGATWLGVYSVGEGMELRQAGIEARILVGGATPPAWACQAIENDLTLTVFSEEGARGVSDAARQAGVRARVHIKVDTGLTRLGVAPEDAASLVRAIARLGHIEIEGVFTHFAMGDAPDAFGIPGWGSRYSEMQLERFRESLAELERNDIRPRYRHCANSPTILKMSEANFNLARTGILVYGLDPSDEVPRPPDFEPALAFKTTVAHVRDVPAGSFVSYGCTWRTERRSRIAVVMVGYGDGFRRGPNNYGDVLVHGERAPIVGRVCMDQTMVDVTDIPGVVAGDEVVLIGRQGALEIRAEDVAKNLGTSDYETVTALSARLERRYVEK
jgi:alanine racemase